MIGLSNITNPTFKNVNQFLSVANKVFIYYKNCYFRPLYLKMKIKQVWPGLEENANWRSETEEHQRKYF